MLARASTVRTVQRIARPFATAVGVPGIKVAVLDHNQPTSAVTILVKAGSRYESKPGVAHALKNFAFKSTAKRSALGTVRESELYGGVLSASLTREHLALTTEFLRGDEAFFVDLLSSFITSAKFTRHEYEEYVGPTIADDAAAAASDPATHAIELAHALAFRTGLGASLFAPAHNPITANDIKAFAASVFTADNIAVLGSGIDPALLTNLVTQSTTGLAPAPSASANSRPHTPPPSSYFGGETRVEAHAGGPQTVFIGFGAVGAPSSVELAVLAAHLSPEAAVKWSRGHSPLATGVLPRGTSVRSVYLPYSDATLVGLLVQGPSVSGIREAGEIAVRVLKDVAAGRVSAEELRKATAKARFAVAGAVDGREGLVSVLGPKVLAGSDTALDASLASFDKVTASGLSTAASALLKKKPTYVAVGDLHGLPYVDELGL